MDIYPTVSFCFGFKPEVDSKDAMVFFNIKNWKQYQSLDAMNATFRSQTYDLKEVLTNITYGKDGNIDSPLNYKVGQTKHNNNKSLVEITEIYSELGRCYSIYTSDIVAVEEAVVLSLKFKRLII